jgi:hypothetical protein
MKNLISISLSGFGPPSVSTSDPLAPRPEAWVQVGPEAYVQLCHRVFMAKGLGQVWHTINHDHPQTYVVSRVDVMGVTRWSLVDDIKTLAAHFNIALRDDGEDVWDITQVTSFAALKKFLEGL